MTMEQNKNEEDCYDKLPSLSVKYPWFVVQNLEDLTHQLFSTLHNPSFKYQCRIPELFGKRIRGCFHGWIILSNHPHNDMWSLWNPSTSNIISLPPLILKDGDYDSIAECCLSAPPDDPNSLLLLMISNKRTFAFCKLSPKRKKSLRKKPRWTEMSYAYQLKKITWNGRLLHSLTCCNGQIYVLCDDTYIHKIVIRVEIVVKDREVVIHLLAFGLVPLPPSNRCCKDLHFLTGYRMEMFYITVCFRRETDKTPGDVYLFKLDMTSIKWKDLECLKEWDWTDLEEADETDPNSKPIFEEFLERVSDYYIDLEITGNLWEEVKDLKDGIFVVDLAHDNSEFYNPEVGSEIGGYIHIHDKMDKLIYSYHINNKTIVSSPVPSSVLPTSRMSMWECWLDDDHREAKFTIDSKQQEDELVVTLITNNEDEVTESHLLDIPFDVLEMIMKFCVGVDYLNFRATCKRCLLAAPMIQWGNQTSLNRLQNYSLVSPWLIVVDQVRGIITLTDPLFGDNYFMKVSQLSIYEETIWCSRFGWLLLKTHHHSPIFFNPFTNDLRKLPETTYMAKSLWFSAPPTSPDCMVIGFVPKYIEIHHVSGEPTWDLYEIDDPYPQQPPICCFPTCHDGDLYYLHGKGELRVFKHLGKDDIFWEVLIAEAPRSCSESPAQYFLVKCDQHLLLVVMGGFGEPIEVFKLNDSAREWEKVNGVGKHMIYICDTTCLCIEAKIPEMENKIYLAQLNSRNKKIVFYSLETSMFHTFNGKNIQENLGDVFVTTHLSAHTWIEPSWLDSQHPKRRRGRRVRSHDAKFSQ